MEDEEMPSPVLNQQICEQYWDRKNTEKKLNVKISLGSDTKTYEWLEQQKVNNQTTIKILDNLEVLYILYKNYIDTYLKDNFENEKRKYTDFEVFKNIIFEKA